MHDGPEAVRNPLKAVKRQNEVEKESRNLNVKRRILFPELEKAPEILHALWREILGIAKMYLGKQG